MTIREADNSALWDTFLSTQPFRPFLQSWTMGEVYRSIGEEPIRLIAEDNGEIVGICQAIVVDARRGRHLAVLYGPLVKSTNYELRITNAILDELKKYALDHNCTFIRFSPFVPQEHTITIPKTISSPLHLLAEHIWYLPLKTGVTPSGDEGQQWTTNGEPRSTEDILMSMRKTTRNLTRRAERDGVTIRKSDDPLNDLEKHFFPLYDDTRKRHKFTPYSNAFIRAQVEHFAPRNECTVYCAEYEGEVIASSVHMHTFGETSYHHGASSSAHHKIPASYLLQWTAIQDALKRGDHIYSFWGISPEGAPKNHPFAGVRTFKTGFGGELLNLESCKDIPLSPKYWGTHMFERVRKWRRGF